MALERAFLLTETPTTSVVVGLPSYLEKSTTPL